MSVTGSFALCGEAKPKRRVLYNFCPGGCCCWQLRGVWAEQPRDGAAGRGEGEHGSVKRLAGDRIAWRGYCT